MQQNHPSPRLVREQEVTAPDIGLQAIDSDDIGLVLDYAQRSDERHADPSLLAEGRVESISGGEELALRPVIDSSITQASSSVLGALVVTDGVDISRHGECHLMAQHER
jgi:hypothetical protein